MGLARRKHSKHQQAETVVRELCIMAPTMAAAAEVPKAVLTSVDRLMVVQVA
jgi:hypothetical protein